MRKTRRFLRKQCVCVVCGKEFETFPWEKGRFCSTACHNKVFGKEAGVIKKASARVRPEHTCIECGKTYPENASNPDSQFCSLKCFGKWNSAYRSGENHPLWQGGKAEFTCIICGKLFKQPRSNAGRAKTCSDKCRHLHQSKIMYRDDVAHDYGIEFNESLKRAIKQRDNYTCQLCDNSPLYRRRLAVHHIDYDKHNNAHSNLITLCSPCHGRTNANRTYWRGYFTAKMSR